MAGKSNRGRNRKGSQIAANQSEQTTVLGAPSNNHSGSSDANGNPVANEPTSNNYDVKELENTSTISKGVGGVDLTVDDQHKQDEVNAAAEPKAKQGGFLCWLLLSAYSFDNSM